MWWGATKREGQSRTCYPYNMGEGHGEGGHRNVELVIK